MIKTKKFSFLYFVMSLTMAYYIYTAGYIAFLRWK